MPVHPSARAYVRAYCGLQARRRGPDYEFVRDAVRRAGGRVLWATPPDTAPMFLALENPEGSRIGVMAYVFHAGHRETPKRDPHEEDVRESVLERLRLSVGPAALSSVVGALVPAGQAGLQASGGA